MVICGEKYRDNDDKAWALTAELGQVAAMTKVLLGIPGAVRRPVSMQSVRQMQKCKQGLLDEHSLLDVVVGGI